MREKSEKKITSNSRIRINERKFWREELQITIKLCGMREKFVKRL